MPPEESTLDSGLVIRLIVCMAVNCQFVPFVIRNHPWLAASVLHGLLLLLAVVLLPIGYGVCDDVIIEWLIANDFSGCGIRGSFIPVCPSHWDGFGRNYPELHGIPSLPTG